MDIKFAQTYLTTACEVWRQEIRDVLIANIVSLRHSLQEVIVSVLRISLAMLLLLAKLLTLVFPHVVVGIRAIVNFHRTQLTWREVAIEAVVLFLITIYFLFRKRIVNTFNRIEADIAKKSRRAARILPHVLFFVFAVIFAIVGQKLLAPLTSLRVLPIFTLGVPAILSFNCLSRNELKTETRTEQEKRLLSLWVVVATYHTVATLLSVIPFSSFFISRLLIVRQIVIVLFIWIHVSDTALDFVSEAIHPIFTRLIARIPTIDIDPSKRNAIFSLLVYLRILTSAQELYMRAIFQDGVSVLIALVFLFTPFPIFGLIAVAFLIPAYHTSICKYSDRKFSEARKWIEYWICFSFLWLIKLLGIQIWSSVLMIIAIYLSHSYFNGCTKVISIFTDLIHALRSRRQLVPLYGKPDAKSVVESPVDEKILISESKNLTEGQGLADEDPSGELSSKLTDFVASKVDQSTCKIDGDATTDSELIHDKSIDGLKKRRKSKS